MYYARSEVPISAKVVLTQYGGIICMKKSLICLICCVLMFVEFSFCSLATEAQATDEEYDLTTCSGVHFYLTVRRPAEKFSATIEDGAEVYYHGTSSSSITIGSIFIGEAQYEFSINEVGIHKLLFSTEGGFSNTYLINVIEHQWDKDTITVEPTCIDNGVLTHTCIICNTTQTETIKALGHAYGEWTKGDDLKHQRACTRCSRVNWEDHKWSDGVVTTAATCDQNGTKEYICEVCGAKKTESIDAIGHAYGQWVKLDDEKHQRICEKDESHVESAEHVWIVSEIITDATCLKAGEHVLTCKYCNATKTITTTGDHLWNSGVVKTEATCKSTGVKTLTCTLCGATKEETIDKKAHKLIKTEAREATCTKPGNIEYYTCSECKGIFADPEGLEEIDINKIETTGHNFVRVKVARKPTTTKEGIELWKCLNCGKNETRTIPKLESEVAPGDVNCDGDVLANDARLALRASAKLETLTETQKKAADVDGSGDVLANDARQILRFSAKLQKEFLKS